MKSIAKLIILAFISTLTFNNSSFAQAQNAAPSARPDSNAKSFVARRGVGKKVMVKLLDGTKAEGRISQIRDNSFDVEAKGRAAPLSINYDNVAEVKKDGWSTAAKIGLGLGIAAGAVVAVVAVAVAKTKIDPFPNGF